MIHGKRPASSEAVARRRELDRPADALMDGWFEARAERDARGMMVSMSAYVIVPARGGSKGIVGKNLRTVGGVPLVARAVLAARDADLVDRVFVTTDDDEIARVARTAGAEVIERPASISGDAST